jgi:hypothetical protein
MHKAIVVLALSLAVCGCNKREAQQPVIGNDPDRMATSAQDLRDAPESIVIGNAVVRLEVFPWENHMPIAAPKDPNTGLTLPDRRKMNISFRLISEHGTPLSSMIRAQTLWILDGELWKTSAIEETFGAADRSSRDFLVHVGPMGQPMNPIDVVVGLKDDTGARHLLASKHQRVGSVE